MTKEREDRKAAQGQDEIEPHISDIVASRPFESGFAFEPTAAYGVLPPMRIEIPRVASDV